MLYLAPFALQAQPGYSLKAVEANPIPKQQHFDLWREVALQQCDDAPSRHNITRAQCASLVKERSDTCAAQQSGSAPQLIRTTAVAKDVGRKYLQCVTPHYFCKGIEVRTEAEARAQCK
ncbi:hypothetical protein HNP48_006606 [Acidovorax soli]|uniref:Uncharacterized protein n=1 Tax=Acidovorax soli TaxID=592050 RepID=A0A7X0UDP3_9BURK|nr:hypothetical protein [Acidovorax soli]MBB6563880.1 hypothetical protein [Acidovorax soli]